MNSFSHIAVVDDDVSVRHSLQRLVKSLGYAVSTHDSANSFLKSPHFAETSCLLLDVKMPGLSGLDLQEVMRALRSPIPIVIMSANRDEEVRERALAHGAIGFLEKPFDDQALMDLVQKSLDRDATA
jgi:FixJ family two-component response regulator